MKGWRPVEDLVQWGFAHAPVVMANEAHDGMAVVVSTDNALNGPRHEHPGPDSR